MAFKTDLNALQIFRAIVEAGSFSKAALILKQPKSRISRHMARLEKELGIQLIYRTTRQFQLTQAGQELYRRTSSPLTDLKSVWDEFAHSSDEISGELRVTVPEDIGAEFMGKVCREFMMLYPKVQINVWASNQFVNLVKDSVDVAVRIGRAKDSTMIQKKIGEVQLIFVMNPEVAARYGDLNKIEDVERLPYLAFKQNEMGASSQSTSIKVTNGKEKKSLKLKPQFSSNNFFTLRQMALLGGGVTLLALFLARDSLARGELVHVCKEWATEAIPIQILIPHQKEPPLRVKKFVDFAAARLLHYLS